MKNKPHHVIRLPKVKENEVLDFMNSGNISMLHIGKEALPYMWYKKMLQMMKCGMHKHMDSKAMNVILAYCIATRKQRRETYCFRARYLKTIETLFLKSEIDKKRKLLDKLNKMK